MWCQGTFLEVVSSNSEANPLTTISNNDKTSLHDYLVFMIIVKKCFLGTIWTIVLPVGSNR